MQNYQDICNFYKGKRVLITGHTGFKGSWLSFWLKKMGAIVVGYSLDPKTEEDFFVSTKLHNHIIDARGDIRNFVNLAEIFKANKPEIVFHLAAQPLVSRAYTDPYETFETNIMGTVNLLKAFQLNISSKTCLIITTDKVYKNEEKNRGYKEKDKLGGHDPYSASKAAVELIVESWRSSFFSGKENFKSISTVRAGNVIGGGDWSEDRLIPDLFKSIISDSDFEVRNPNSIRPWQHVLEPLYGYLILAYKMSIDKFSYNDSYNFGPKETLQKTVFQLVNDIAKLSNFNKIVIKDQLNIHETKILKLNSSKVSKVLGWSSRLTYLETIKMINEWYSNKMKKDYYEMANKQIDFYISKIKNHEFK